MKKTLVKINKDSITSTERANWISGCDSGRFERAAALNETETPKEAKRKLGANRGKTRLWLEGKLLSEKGWSQGDRFLVAYLDGVVIYAKAPNGARKVAGSHERPIIDTNTDKLSTSLNAMTGEVVNVSSLSASITIQKA